MLLKRPNGYVLAAFGKRVRPENIQRVAKADEKYLRAVERMDKFGLTAARIVERVAAELGEDVPVPDDLGSRDVTIDVGAEQLEAL